MTQLTIGSTLVRQMDGLYSLNDLHAASGGEKNQQPANFLRLDQTQALIAEIQSSEMRSAVKTINGGPKRGTYVCRELVYAYANWISPAFYLKMIRAFDVMVVARVPPRGDFNLRATMMEHTGTPTVALPADVKTAINRKAWTMAHDAYELCREHLAGRVAYCCEYGIPPNRSIKPAHALDLIADATLDTVLAPRHFDVLTSVMRIAEVEANVARENAEKIRAELERHGVGWHG